MSEKIKIDRCLAPYLAEEGERYSEEGDDSYLFHENVTLSDIDKAYREATKDLHPDQGGHSKAFKRVLTEKNRLESIMEEGRTYDIVPSMPQSQDKKEYEDSTDFQVNTGGVVSKMEQMVREMEREMDETVRRVAREEMELIEKIRRGEIDPEEIPSGDDFL